MINKCELCLKNVSCENATDSSSGEQKAIKAQMNSMKM